MIKQKGLANLLCPNHKEWSTANDESKDSISHG